jgi:hypothetical protein
LSDIYLNFFKVKNLGGRRRGMLIGWTSKTDQGRNVREQRKGYKNKINYFSQQAICTS